MKKKLLSVVLATCMVMSFSGCLDEFIDDSSNSGASSSVAEDSQNLSSSEAAAPRSANDCKDTNYKKIVKEFEEAGFRNIETKPLGDMVIGLLSTEDEVKKITIDGKDNFKKGDVFSKNSKIVITYHSYPEDDSEEGSETEETTTQETTTTKEPTTTKETTTTKKTTTKATTTENLNTVLTVQNNKDLAQILSDYCSPSVYKAFSEKYRGRTIEFDGCIAYVSLHGNYTTRYDFLIYSGNYNDEASNRGVNMQIRNVNFSGLHLTGSDTAKEGMNIHVKATVGEFSSGELLYIEPIAITVR